MAHLFDSHQTSWVCLQTLQVGAGANPNRTTRIFVARIPPHVSDDQFRAYFAQFGAVQACSCP